jgi:hypothetical protein
MRPVMSDQDDWDFAGADDAKVTIRAAVRYLLRGTTDGVRGDIVQEIISIVRQVANGPPSDQADPLEDDMPGG